MRVGLFGGTFDPPHRGHLAVAQAAAARFALDEVLLAPTGRQPLKDAAPSASFEARLEMVRLLCAGEPLLRASELDGPRPDGSPNYTVDNLRLLAQRDETYVIVGADSFLDLRRWREPDELLRLAEWVVVSRPGFPLDDLSSLQLAPEQAVRVHVLKDLHMAISATEVRRRLSGGLPVEDLMTPEVAAYIQAHGLYQTGIKSSQGM